MRPPTSQRASRSRRRSPWTARPRVSHDVSENAPPYPLCMTRHGKRNPACVPGCPRTPRARRHDAPRVARLPDLPVCAGRALSEGPYARSPRRCRYPRSWRRQRGKIQAGAEGNAERPGRPREEAVRPVPWDGHPQVLRLPRRRGVARGQLLDVQMRAGRVRPHQGRGLPRDRRQRRRGEVFRVLDGPREEAGHGAVPPVQGHEVHLLQKRGLAMTTRDAQ